MRVTHPERGYSYEIHPGTLLALDPLGYLTPTKDPLKAVGTATEPLIAHSTPFHPSTFYDMTRTFEGEWAEEHREAEALYEEDDYGQLEFTP